MYEGIFNIDLALFLHVISSIDECDGMNVQPSLPSGILIYIHRRFKPDGTLYSTYIDALF